MGQFDRRAFLGFSAGALSFLQVPSVSFAQTACVSSGLAPFLPNRLTVDCATKRNFQSYRKNSDYMGLTGVVSMTYVPGKLGNYSAGNLFLFPWLNKKGLALGAAKEWQAVVPVSATEVVSASPIPGWTLPLDEYFCNFRLQAPRQMFIGFRVDQAFSRGEAQREWFTNVDKLADGKSIGIAWTSSNLNGPWFGGSRFIPNSDTCNGASWRKLIVDGINQASVPSC